MSSKVAKFEEYARKQKEKKLMKTMMKKEKPTWVDSLGEQIVDTVTLEIGNPIDDGYNYIKQVHNNDEINKKEIIELRIENNNLKKEVEKYKKKCQELSEIITRKERSIFKII